MSQDIIISFQATSQVKYVILRKYTYTYFAHTYMTPAY